MISMDILYGHCGHLGAQGHTAAINQDSGVRASFPVGIPNGTPVLGVMRHRPGLDTKVEQRCFGIIAQRFVPRRRTW